MKVTQDPMEIFKHLHDTLNPIDYRITGLTAVNLYGYGISTNVFDIAVESDEAVYKAVDLLELSTPAFPGYDPYIWMHKEDDGRCFYIKIQGDLMGEPFMHPQI